jgi:hypothetical protein
VLHLPVSAVKKKIISRAADDNRLTRIYADEKNRDVNNADASHKLSVILVKLKAFTRTPGTTLPR